MYVKSPFLIVKLSILLPFWRRRCLVRAVLTLTERADSVASGAGYVGEQDEGGKGHGCLTEAVHNRRVKIIKSNLTRETRRARLTYSTV